MAKFNTTLNQSPFEEEDDGLQETGEDVSVIDVGGIANATAAGDYPGGDALGATGGWNVAHDLNGLGNGLSGETILITDNPVIQPVQAPDAFQTTTIDAFSTGQNEAETAANSDSSSDSPYFDCAAAKEIGGDIGAVGGGAAAALTVGASFAAPTLLTAPEPPVSYAIAGTGILATMQAYEFGEAHGEALGEAAGYGTCVAGNEVVEGVNAVSDYVSEVIDDWQTEDNSTASQPAPTPAEQVQSSSDTLQVAIADAFNTSPNDAVETAPAGFATDFTLDTAAQAQQPDVIGNAIQDALGSSVQIYPDLTEPSVETGNAASMDSSFASTPAFDAAPVASAPTVGSGPSVDTGSVAASIPAPSFDSGGSSSSSSGGESYDGGGGE